MQISVIVPTYNRCQILEKCLISLLHQSIPRPEYEILVIDDGSSDGTREFMLNFASSHKNVFYFEQVHRGPASARNIGIKHSKGKYLFFTGDDIVASCDLLKEHLAMLEPRNNIAVLGLTLWDASIDVSEFMEFIINRGHQFAFRRLKHGQYCPWGMFYTSNISLEKYWFESELFDEDFIYPIWEDCELGYRLFKNGLKIAFNEKALAFHHHIITEKGFYNKVRQSGISRISFYKKHPELITPLFFIAKTKAILFIFKGINIYNKILILLKLDVLAWELNLWYYAILGIHEGLKKSGN